MSLITVLDARQTALADHWRRRRLRGPLIDVEQAAVIRRLESHGSVRGDRVREALFDSQNDGVQRIDSGSGRGRGRRGGQHRY